MNPMPPKLAARAAFLPAALLTACLPASAAIRSGDWTGDFSIPCFDGVVNACAIHGDYYVAGDFRWAGGVSARNVARWTGSGWAPVGGGLPTPVQRLAVWGTDLLAATTANPGAGSPVMRLELGSWRPLGSQLYGSAEAMLVDAGALYIGGQLYPLGGDNSNRVMRWDGAEWLPVGGTFDGPIHALAMWRGQLYVGGEFLDAEGRYVSRIATWDGAHWQPVGEGTNAGGGVAVRALAVYGDRLIAGGYFSAMGGVPARGIAAWDGAVWDSLPGTPKDCFVSDLEVEGGLLHVAGVLQVPNLYAAGVVTFDGQVWRTPAPYPDWGIQDLAAEGGRMIGVGYPTYVAGGTPAISTQPARDVVVRDPTWRPLFAWNETMRGLLGPAHTEVMALHAHGGQIYAGGYFEWAATPPGWTYTGSLVRWNGQRWEAADRGELRGWVQTMASWGDRLVVGGAGFYSGSARSSVLAWDGNAWSDLGGPLEGYVMGLTEWQGALVAAGGVRLPGQQAWSAVAIHQTSGWQILGQPLVTDQTSVYGVASFRNDLYVAGVGLQAPGGLYGLLRWQDGQWTPVPGTPVGAVRCLLARADGLWISLASYSAVAPGLVWRWDGETWTQMGDLPGDPTTLAEADGDVVAGGSFWIGSSDATGLARWDGSRWLPVAGGPTGAVETIAALESDLYLGGWFRHTGQSQTEALARWSFVSDSPPPAGAGTLSSWPSPASVQVGFRFSLPRAGRASLALYDLKGAKVATVFDEALPAGYSERLWAIPRRRLPAGVYFTRLEAPGVSARGKLVIAR